jgi:hypothetical protein
MNGPNHAEACFVQEIGGEHPNKGFVFRDEHHSTHQGQRLVHASESNSG